MYFIAIDIGCCECDEETNVLGIFTDKTKATEVLKEHKERQGMNWNGHHEFQIFQLEKLDKVYRTEYKIED